MKKTQVITSVVLTTVMICVGVYFMYAYNFSWWFILTATIMVAFVVIRTTTQVKERSGKIVEGNGKESV